MQLRQYQFPALIVLGALIGYFAATVKFSQQGSIDTPTELQFANEPVCEPTSSVPCCAEGLNKKMQLTRSSPTQVAGANQ